MMKRIVLILLGFMLAAGIASGSEHKEIGSMNDVEKSQQIKSLATAKDLSGLRELADTVQAASEETDPVSYGRSVLEICSALVNYGFDDNRQYDMSRQYARSAAQRNDEFPVDLALSLLTYAYPEIEAGVDEAEFVSLRRRGAEAWLRAWQRLRADIDPDWDPNDLPESNVSPPVETGLPSGVAPSAIEDPQLRAQYEAAIEKNSRKNERYKEQYRLRNTEKSMMKSGAERFLIQMYSRPPFATAELEALLDRYLTDAEAKVSILDAVREAEQSQASE